MILISFPPPGLLVILSRPTGFVLAQNPPPPPPSNSSSKTTVSLWLPWFQGIPQNLEASVIQAVRLVPPHLIPNTNPPCPLQLPNATIDLISCPSPAISDPDTPSTSTLCLLDAPQTITAAPYLALASSVRKGITKTGIVPSPALMMLRRPL